MSYQKKKYFVPSTVGECVARGRKIAGEKELKLLDEDIESEQPRNVPEFMEAANDALERMVSDAGGRYCSTKVTKCVTLPEQFVERAI